MENPSLASLVFKEENSLLQLSNRLGEMMKSRICEMQNAGVPLVSHRALNDHFDYHVKRIRTQLEHAAQTNGPDANSVNITLDKNDLDLLIQITKCKIEYPKLARPVEYVPTPLPPAAIPVGGLLSTPKISDSRECDLLMPPEPSVLYAPSHSVAGEPSEAKVYGVDNLAHRFASCNLLKKRDQFEKKYRTPKRGLAYLKDKRRDWYEVDMVKRNKRPKTSVRTTDIPPVKSPLSLAVSQSTMVQRLAGEILDYDRETVERAHHTSLALHAPRQCKLCDYIAKRLAIKDKDNGPEFLLSAKDRRLITVLHIYENNGFTRNLDQYIHETGVMYRHEAIDDDKVQQWSVISRACDASDLDQVDEIATDAETWAESLPEEEDF